MIAKFQTLKIEYGITTSVMLNRPEVHNAINETMIRELTVAFTEIQKDISVRLIILKGLGKSFCAGADLNYMKDIARFSPEENYEDAIKLATLFKTIYNCTVPTLAIVHGSAYGGANGLLSTCDIVLAEENTIFAFSEVKIGIVPATISPFVIKRIGEFNARDLMLTGRRIKGHEAEKIGLINKAVSKENFDFEIDKIIAEFNTSAPKAVGTTKLIINKVTNEDLNMDDEIKYTASIIATQRAAEEGVEGITAFLEKRKPKWVIKNKID